MSKRRVKQAGSGGELKAGSGSNVSPGMRWVFRLGAMVVLPVLVLVLSEVGLRLAGYGYDTRFFVESEVGGETRLVTNPKFGYRFFPPKLARTPSPYSFVREKAPGTYRIFLFGESAALGDPQPAYGMGRYLQALLELRYPEAKFEVIPAAMTAINSHALVDMARECADYDGDLWIIYMGNNEMVGPFGAMTLFGAEAPSRLVIRAGLAFKRMRLGQWMAEHLGGGGVMEALPEQWGGLGMFLEKALAPDDPKRGVVEEHFGANLRDMVASGQRAGAGILLCTVGGNLLDCPPFASRHALSFDAGLAGAWSNHVSAAVSAQAGGDWAGALAELDHAAGMDAGYAEVRYRQGVVALELGGGEAALAHLRAASDGDALAFRTGSDLNRMVRELAGAESGVGLVDIEELLNEEGPVGREVFLDHVHYDFAGNERVARWLAEEVAGRLPEAMKGGAKPRFARTDAVEARLGLTDWNRVRVWEEMLRRFQQAPFTGQLGHGERDEWMAGRIAGLRDALHPRRYLEAEDIYLEAIGVHPKDPLLQENFAVFLEATDDLQRAVETWQSVSSLMPENPLPWFEQGRLLSRLGQMDGARGAFERSLALRPDLDEARLELGQLLFRQQRYEEALAMYEDLRSRNPNNPRVLRHMADPLGALERRGEVIECLSKAVELSPSYWEARYLLAVELGFKKDFIAAQQQFALVVQQRPDFVLARDNLGVSYVRTGKLREAREQFVEALRLDPQNAAVRQHLESLDALLQRLSEEQERR